MPVSELLPWLPPQANAIFVRERILRTLTFVEISLRKTNVHTLKFKHPLTL